MNFTAFRYFNEVVKAGAIRRAADRLHVAPSAVSRQIAILERQLGTPLLERNNSGIRLTPAGVILERYTRQVFRDLERVQESITRYRGLQAGEVKLDVIEGLLSNILPATITRLHARFPAITFNIRALSTDRIVEALIRNECDIGIAFNVRERPEIAVVAERADPVMALVAPTDPFAGRSSVSLEELAARNLALPHADWGMRQMFDAAMAEAGLSPVVVTVANNLELPRALAMTGDVVTIGPALNATAQIRDGTLVAVAVDHPLFRAVRSSVCVHRDRQLSFAANEFLKLLTRTLLDPAIAE